MSIEKEIEESSGKGHASTGKMFSYAIGDIVAYYLLTAYSLYVFYYYEVEVGLAVSLVALRLTINSVNLYRTLWLSIHFSDFLVQTYEKHLIYLLIKYFL